jgi:cell division inhibitor SulA/protein ImuA
MSSLDVLLRNAAVWRGSEQGSAPLSGTPSGFAALDERLGGWPQGALIELIAQREGVGELSLLLPALARLSADERWLSFVNPPYVPYAPALATAGVDLARVVVVRAQGGADTLWAMEQSLRSGACGAVLAWPGFITERAIRRLQLAAETGRALAVCFAANGAPARPSPVPYRLRVDSHPGGMRVEILKRRGGMTATVLLEDVAESSFSPPADRDLPAGGLIA